MLQTPLDFVYPRLCPPLSLTAQLCRDGDVESLAVPPLIMALAFPHVAERRGCIKVQSSKNPPPSNHQSSPTLKVSACYWGEGNVIFEISAFLGPLR